MTTTAPQALTLNPLRPGQVQNLVLPCGIKLDQDGNRFPSRTAKLAYLESCLAAGLRSGNLQRITTDNQRNDLLARIEQTRREIAAGQI